MLLDFSNVKESDGLGKLPEGNHVMYVENVTPLKKNKGGNIGFMMWFKKEGYKGVNQYLQLTDNVMDKRRIMNVLTAFNTKLEQREYKPKEIYQLIKDTEGKKCEAEIYHKDDSFENDDGETIKFKRRQIATLKPVSEEENLEIEEDDDLGDIDLD